METVRPLILINRDSKGKTAEKWWDCIKGEVISRFPDQPLTFFYEFPLFLNGHKALDELIDGNKINTIISAGGDGSINFFANYLIQAGKSNEISLGAIGLGSSNDFHKPVKKTIKGIPVRLDYMNRIVSDLGKVEFLDLNGERKCKYFIINASLGVTAEANSYFNRAKGILQLLKSRSTQAAIYFTALRTILRFRNFPATLWYNGKERQVKLTNLAVLKNSHVSGDMYYDQEIEPSDGKLGLNYCFDMSKTDLIKLLIDLGNGNFKGKPKRFSEYTTSLNVRTALPVAIETDGEVDLGTDFRFSILPGVLTTLGYN